jgi:hypothetical protein
MGVLDATVNVPGGHERTLWLEFADSPLEERRFELSVPP